MRSLFTDYFSRNIFANFLDTDLSEETTEVKPLKWEEDMQLFSRFLDRKVGVTILVRLYVT